MLKLILVVTLATIVACTKKTEPKKFEPKYPCQNNCEFLDKELCESLFKEYSACEKKKTESACKGFLDAFGKALPKTVKCTNTCSEDPFDMAITYSCDEIDQAGYPKITERSSHLLSKLTFPAARKLFLSEAFEGILDGALSEDIRPVLDKLKAKQ